MKNSFKKLTAWLCCMALLISFIPATALPAFAAEEPTGVTSFSQMKEPGTYKVNKAFTTTGKIPLDGTDTYVLDLNSYKLTLNASRGVPLFTLTDSAELTIKDTGTGGKGELYTTATEGSIISLNSGTLNVEGGTFTGGSSSIAVTGGTLNISGAPNIKVVATGGTVNIGNLAKDAEITLSGSGYTLKTDGTVQDKGNGLYVGKEPDAAKYHIYDITSDTNGSIKVTVDGVETDEAAENKTVTVTAKPSGGYLLNAVTVTKKASDESVTATVDATNSNVYTFTMPNEAVNVVATFEKDETEYTISLGTITGNGNVTLNGGTEAIKATYHNPVSVTIVATADEGYELKALYLDGSPIDNNKTIQLKSKSHVVTAEFYDPNALPALPPSGAIGSSEEATTYVLNSAEVALTGGLTISGDVTLDLKGNTLTGGVAPYFTIPAGAKLTIKDSSEAETGAVKGMASATNAMILVNGGEFVLTSGKLTGNTNNGNLGGAIYAAKAGSKVTINGGEISGNTARRGGAISGPDTATAVDVTIKITDGVVTGNATERGATLYTQTGATVIIEGGKAGYGTLNGEATNGNSSHEDLWVRNSVMNVTGGDINGVTFNVTADGGYTMAISGDPVIKNLNGVKAEYASIGSLEPGASVTVTGGALTITDNKTVVENNKVYTYNYTPRAITVSEYDTKKGTVTISVGESTDVAEAKCGDEVTVTAAPSDAQYAMKSITVTKTDDANTVIEVTNNKFTMPDYPVTVTVVFEALGADKSIVKLTQPSEGGTVSVNDGVTLGEQIAAGTQVVISTNPDTGYTITLTMGGKEVELTDGKYTFKAEGGKVHDIVATAKKVDYTVTLKYGEGSVGTATPNKTTANYGDEITVAADQGYELVSVAVDNEGTAVTDGKFTMPAANVTVTVVTKERELPAYANLNSVTSGTLPEGIYTLTENQTLTDTLVIKNGAVVIIDLNGYTIKMVEDCYKPYFDIATKDSKLTIRDSSKTETGKIEFKNVVPAGEPVDKHSSAGVAVTGTFVLEGGEMNGWKRQTTDGTYGAGGFINLFANATFKMTGGKITGAAASGMSAIRSHGAGVTVDITGGEISGNEGANGNIIQVGKAGGQSWLHIGGDAKIQDNTKGGEALPFNIDAITAVETIVTIDGNAHVEANVQATLGEGATAVALESSQINISGAPYVKYLRADSASKTQFTVTELEPGAEIHTSYGFTADADNVDASVAVEEWKGESGNANEAGKIYTFNYPLCDITLNQNEVAGTVAVDPAQAKYGDKVQLSVVAENGDYKLIGFTVTWDGGTVDVAADYSFVMPNGAVTVTPDFVELGDGYAAPTRDTKMTNGTVTFEPIWGAVGDPITVTVTPDTGYELSEITVDGEKLNAVEGVYTFNLVAGKENNVVNAIFEQIDYTVALTVNDEDMGAVKDIPATAHYQDIVSFTLEPVKGYRMKSVKLGENELKADANGVYSFEMPAEDVAVAVEFEEILYHDVTLVVDEAVGSAKVDVTTAARDQVVTVTYEAKDGYLFSKIVVTAGEANVPVSGNTFVMPEASVTVKVEFVKATLPKKGTVQAGVYILTENVYLENALSVYDNVTVDLNGYSIYSIDADAKAICGIFTVGNADTPGTLTIKDSSKAETGALYSGSNNGTPAIHVQAGSFTLDGGTITGWNRAGGAGGAVFLGANTSFTMNGGKITGNSAGDRAAVRADLGGHTITINGGEISGNTSTTAAAVVRVTGGTTKDGVTYKHSTVKITGGTIAGNTTKDGYANVQFDTCDVTITGNPVIESMAITGNRTATIGELVKGAEVTTTVADKLTVTDRTVYTKDGLTYEGVDWVYESKVDNKATKNGELNLSVKADDAFRAGKSVLAPEGEKVYVYATAEGGYMLTGMNFVNAETGEAIEVESNVAESWFIMPAVDIKISGEFGKIPSDKSVVLVEQPLGGGEVSVSAKDTVNAGTEIEVTYTVEADKGYELGQITVNGEKLEANADGKYVFTTEGKTTYVVTATMVKTAFTITSSDPEQDKSAVYPSVWAAKYGETFTIKTGLDYKLVSVTVTYKDATGAVVELAANEDGSYTMPAADVVYTAVIAAADLLTDVGSLHERDSNTLDEGIYTVNKKTTLTSALTINGRVVIDLAGETVQMAQGADFTPFYVNGRLTIMDTVGGGKIKFNPTAGSPGFNVTGELILEGGELTGWKRVSEGAIAGAGGLIYLSAANTKFTMNGGKITDVACGNQAVIRTPDKDLGGIVVTLAGGEITGNEVLSGSLVDVRGTAANRSTLNIGDIYFHDNKGPVEIDVKNTDVFVSGAAKVGMMNLDAASKGSIGKLTEGAEVTMAKANVLEITDGRESVYTADGLTYVCAKTFEIAVDEVENGEMALSLTGSADAVDANLVIPANTKVYFSAVPAELHRVKEKSLKITNAEGVDITETVTFDMDKQFIIMPDCDVVVSIEFEPIPNDRSVVTVVQPSAGGTIHVSATGEVDADSKIEIEIDVVPGYALESVLVNEEEIAATEGKYVFTTEGGKGHTVTATFTKILYTITADEKVDGKATASVSSAKVGDTFTIKAALDYKLVSVTVTYKDATGAVVELAANDDGSYTMPAADVAFNVTVEAAGEIPEAEGALPASGTVADGKYVLTKDHTVTGTLTINGRVVIDLAGKTIKMHRDMDASVFYIKGRLTIMDTVGGGKIQFKTMSKSGAITNYGEFILQRGELTGWNRKDATTGAYAAGGFIDMMANSTFEMTGGKITNMAATTQVVIRCHEAAIGGHTVKITGGEITGNSATTGNIISVDGAENNRSKLIIGGTAKIGENNFNGVKYTYANYEFTGTNTDIIIEDRPTIGMIAPGTGSTVTISGAPKINALRATLEGDRLKEAKSITLNELDDGALIITGGGLDLSKVTTVPVSVASAYWNNQNKATQYQGYVYFPAFTAEYNQPMDANLLPEGLSWAEEVAKFATVGEGVYKINVEANEVTADLTVDVQPQVVDLAEVYVEDQIFTGEQIKPELTLIDGYDNEIPADQIVVTYGENVNLGKGTIYVTNASANADEEADADEEVQNYSFVGEISFQIVQGKTDLGYPTGSMMVAIKPNTVTTGNTIALTVPAKAGDVKVTIGDVTGAADFVKNVKYANGAIIFDTTAKALNTEAQFTVTVEMTNYETVQLIVKVKSFEKKLPTGLTATYGDTLADVSLDDGWRWADPTQSVGNAGKNNFEVYFSNESATTKVEVTVLPKDIEIVYALANDTTAIIFNGEAKTPAVVVKDSEGTTIPADQYTVVYGDNNVNAGTATYTIKAGSNYSFDDATGTFTIAKATKKLAAQNRGVSAANAATATVDMGSMLPANRDGVNKTAYSWNVTSGASAIQNVKVENGVVTIATNALNRAATATVEVVATSDNYNPITLIIKVELKVKEVVGGGPIVTPDISGGYEEPEDPKQPDTTVETDEKGNKVTTTTDKSGNTIVVVESANGVTATTTSDLYGRYTTSVVIPSSAATGSEPVVLPVEGKGQASVTVPGTVKVEFPVENVTPGTIAVIVNADGTETLIKDAKQSEDGMVFTLTEDCTVKVYDNAKSFSDLAGHWSGNAVAFVTARGMFAGTGNGTTFSPEVKMTRAMLAQVIYNLEGAEDHSHDANFADVTADAWYSKAVNWAAREGIVSGYSNGTYQPDKALTREEVVQIFYNYAKSKGYDMSHSADLSTFADGHEVSDWALSAKQWGVGAGLISGKGGNVLDAKGGATRAEGAQMFMNFCQNIAQ